MTGREFFERYGITLAVIGALVLVLAILPGNASKRTATGVVQQNGTPSDGTDLAAGGRQPGGDGTTTPAGGGATITTVKASTGGSVGPSHIGKLTDKPGVIFGKGLCRADGRQVGISRYSPPCATWVGGNGASTWRGVTSNKIRIVRWLGQVTAATQAVLQANKLADDPAVRTRSFKSLFTYANQHVMTYGRQVEMIDYNASGPSEKDEAMHADAINIANLKAFGVVLGTPDAQLPDVLARDLARRGIVCICTVSPTTKYYTDQNPYIFGPGLPPGTLYSEHVAEYVSKRLNGGKAKWAGDPNTINGLTTQKRRFGLVYVNGANHKVDPEAMNVQKEMVAKLAAKGVKLAAKVGYNYAPGENQNDITNMIAQLQAAKVTTVIMWVDPLTPIFITPEATRQRFFPEWLITGSGLSDTTSAGRLYDQQQWRHAFGISPLPVLWQNVRLSGGYRAAHHGDPAMAHGAEGVLVSVYAAYVSNMFLGIHMAGPVLTPDTFAQGMFRYPKTGGSAAYPTVFFTRPLPSAVKDFTEIWYNPTASGKDERDNTGTGMMMHVDDGRRYSLGQWPKSESVVFNASRAITNTDNPPGGFDGPHEQDGHKHAGACMSCPGFKTYK